MSQATSSDVTQELLLRRAASLAVPVEQKAVRRISLGVFGVGAHQLAVPLASFQQVFEVRAITAIPCGPSYFLGMCVASGSTLTLVNTGDFFKLRSVVATDMRNGIVLTNGVRSIAFGARDLLGIDEVEENSLRPIVHESNCFTHAVASTLVIDPAAVFADPRLSQSAAT